MNIWNITYYKILIVLKWLIFDDWFSQQIIQKAYTLEVTTVLGEVQTSDLHELWRRIVIGVLIGNLDDHLRNHGFLYDKDDKWLLSPAYDLSPVPLEEKARELTTWISEEGPDADLDIARRAAPYFALKDDQAEAIISEVSTALIGWQNTARQLDVSPADIAIYATAIQSDA